MYIYAYAYLGTCVLHALGQPRELHTHTYIWCCGTLCYCATTPSLLGHNESACTYICAYALLVFTCLAYVGPAMRATRAYIATHKRCCCTLCYCSTTPSLLVRDDTVRTKLLALQTDSSARGTPCTMCNPSMHGIMMALPPFLQLGIATCTCSFTLWNCHISSRRNNTMTDQCFHSLIWNRDLLSNI